MKGRTAIILMALAAASAAQADAFCDIFNELLSGRTAASVGLKHDMQGAAALCGTSLAMNGQTSLNCSWAFGFRAQAASQAFLELRETVAQCLQVTESHADQPVSHPDFYDLRLFETALGDVGVSLKDKGAIAQTLVFLRITPDP